MSENRTLVKEAVVGFAMLLAAGLILAGEPVEVRAKSGVDFSRYASYAWAAREGLVADHPLAEGSPLDVEIKNAADRTLAAKGFARLDRGMSPDLLINYVGVARDVLETEGVTKSLGKGVQWIGDPNAHAVRSYREGTLVFEVVDAESGEMVWSGWVIELAADVAKLRAKAEKATRKVFKHFPSQ